MLKDEIEKKSIKKDLKKEPKLTYQTRDLNHKIVTTP